jgi:hypothetical protein
LPEGKNSYIKNKINYNENIFSDTVSHRTVSIEGNCTAQSSSYRSGAQITATELWQRMRTKGGKRDPHSALTASISTYDNTKCNTHTQPSAVNSIILPPLMNIQLKNTYRKNSFSLFNNDVVVGQNGLSLGEEQIYMYM